MARKRAVGEGSISHRKDGRWEAALTCRTTSGIRKRIRRYATSRAEADEKLSELKAQARQGVPVPDKSWRLGAYLDYWLEHIVRPHRRPATYEKDEQAIRLYLKPGLGSAQLTRLTVPRLQLFLNEQLAAGRSVSTVHQIAKVLSAALTRAMKEELVTRNVARLVDLPSYTSAEIQPWSMQEARDFLNAAREDPLLPAFALALLYGLRRGEVLGLRWADVDFDAGILHVRQQLQRRRSGLLIGDVKTKASTRDLSLRPIARTVLLAQQRAQERLRKKAGAEWKSANVEAALVFTTSTGNPIEPRNFNRSFHRICEQHGIRRIRVHDLRHTVATFLSVLQVSPKDAQFTLGHSQVSTTMGIYQHASLSSSERAIAPVEAQLVQDESFVAGLLGQRCRSRQGATRSRQIRPSKQVFLDGNLAATPGAEDGYRTRDPRLTMPSGVTLDERLTSVNKSLLVHARRWHVGIVAVNSSRQTRPFGCPRTRRNVPASAFAVHGVRCAPSHRPVPAQESLP